MYFMNSDFSKDWKQNSSEDIKWIQILKTDKSKIINFNHWKTTNPIKMVNLIMRTFIDGETYNEMIYERLDVQTRKNE